MPSLARSRLVRDVFLVFLGAVSMHFVTTLFHPFDDLNPTWTLQSYHQEEIVIDPPPYDEHIDGNKHDNNNPAFGEGDEPSSTAVTLVDVTTTIPETELVGHAPGWTIFKNLYMSNGTFYVVSDKPRSEFPELLYILSVPIPALNTPENIQARLPTDQEMSFISTKDAEWRWGAVKPGDKNRVWPITGNTVCVLFTRLKKSFVSSSMRSLRFSCWTRNFFSQICSGGPSPILTMISSRVLHTLSGSSTIPCNVCDSILLITTVDPTW